MKRSFYIESQGVNIFYIDFSGLQTENEVIEVLVESKIEIRSHPIKSMINLANITGMHFNNSIKELFFEFVKGNANYVLHSAIVGVDGIRRIVFNGIMKLSGRDVRCFNLVEDAKKWLVERKNEKCQV